MLGEAVGAANFVSCAVRCTTFVRNRRHGRCFKPPSALLVDQGEADGVRR